MIGKYRSEVDYLKRTLERGSEYADENQDVVQYIGPEGENELRYFEMSVSYFSSICKSIINGEGILRIQTDPTTACKACWLANERKFGLHCIPDLNTPEAERDFHFPLENNDVLHLEVLSNILCIPIAEEPGITEGIINKHINVRLDIMRELLIHNSEFNSGIVKEIADQLKTGYERIGIFNFDWIFYVFNQRA